MYHPDDKVKHTGTIALLHSKNQTTSIAQTEINEQENHQF